MRYAMIDSNSGYVWDVREATDAVTACAEMDVDFTYGATDRVHEELTTSEARGGRDHYLVYDATELAVEIDDGQQPEQIAAVEALPLVAYVGWRRVDV